MNFTMFVVPCGLRLSKPSPIEIFIVTCTAMKTRKKAILGIVLLGTLLVMGACSKDKNTLLHNDWKVVGLKVNIDSTLEYTPENKTYTLDFQNNHKYSVELDVNGCTGKVKFQSGHSLDFSSNTICTTICCDTHFASTMLNILIEKVNQYEIQNNVLVLKGEDGEIIQLKKM